MNKVIAIDFDGVLCCSPYPQAKHQNFLNKFFLWYIKRRQRKGDIIILWTCRTDDVEVIDGHGIHVHKNSLKSALKFLKEKNFIPDLVNQNIDDRIRMFGGSSRKISADLYIDDKNIGIIGLCTRKYFKLCLKRIMKNEMGSAM